MIISKVIAKVKQQLRSVLFMHLSRFRHYGRRIISLRLQTRTASPWKWTVLIKTFNNTNRYYCNSQFGILIPAGMPLLAKVRTSRDVKSGRWNWSFSYAVPQGNFGRKCSARSTSVPSRALISLLTIATNPVAKQQYPLISTIDCSTLTIQCDSGSFVLYKYTDMHCHFDKTCFAKMCI